MSLNLPGVYLYHLAKDNLAPEEYERIISPHAAWARICREYEFDDNHHASHYLINMREPGPRSSPDQARSNGMREKEIAVDYGVSYGVNGKDVVTTSMLISQLGSFGIKATTYINHKGTELIKLTGYPGIRKILNAPVFAAKNPKVVDLGIGKYGLQKTIFKGARVTFYVAAAYRTIDFMLNDATSLAEYLGPLATDVAKIGIASAISWGIGAVVVTPFIAFNLVIVVAVGLLAAWGLNELDDKFGITDKVVEYIETAQQEFAEKARDMGKGIWDLGAMYADSMLDKGKEVIEYEVRKYMRNTLKDIIPRMY